MKWVKLNTDGARAHKGNAGCGGVIRGNEGECLGGFSKSIGLCSSYTTEL